MWFKCVHCIHFATKSPTRSFHICHQSRSSKIPLRLPGLSRYRNPDVGYTRDCHETLFFFPRWSLCFSVNERRTQRAQTVLFRTASYFSLCYRSMIVTRRFSLMSSTIYSLFLSVHAFRVLPLQRRSAVSVFLPLKCSLHRVCPTRVVDNVLPAKRTYFAHGESNMRVIFL